MNLLKTFGIVLIAAMILTFGAEFGEQLSIPGAGPLVLTAEARVGRPLTPVSVAGVARRTTRRCQAVASSCPEDVGGAIVRQEGLLMRKIS